MTNRRSIVFTVAGLATALVLALTLGWLPVPAARAQAPVVLKIQATWPASLTLFDHLKLVAERVDKLSGGTLKIEALPAGDDRPGLRGPRRDQQEGHRRRARRRLLLGRQEQDRRAVHRRPRRQLRHGLRRLLGWMYEGGGLELYQEFYKDVLKLNVVASPGVLPPARRRSAGSSGRSRDLADFKGMKCRQTGINAEVYTEMGMRTVNLPGGEIIPAAERGVIDCAEWVGGIEDLRLGFHNVWKYHYTPGMHEPVTMGELLINAEVWEQALARCTRRSSSRPPIEAFIRWYAKWQRQNADALKEFLEKHKVNVLKTPHEILIEFLKTWDRIAAARGGEGSLLQEGAGVAAAVRGGRRARQAVPVPALRLRGQLLLAGEEAATAIAAARAADAVRPRGSPP